MSRHSSHLYKLHTGSHLVGSKFPAVRQSPQFWLLAGFLPFAFLFGGGARDDVASLIVLRPVAIMICGIGLCMLSSAQVARYRLLLGMAGAAILVALLHLVPLPPDLWTSLPGRELVVEVGRVAGVEQVWRPLSLTPAATWNGLYAISVPLAALLLAVQLTKEERFALLPLLILLGVVSGFLGLLQVGGASNGPLYFYRITNNGAAVGFFANRNHQALYLACLFPMLAVFAAAGKTGESVRRRTWIAAAIGVVLVPLLLVAGSRAGLVLGFVGLLSAPFLYHPLGQTWPMRPRRPLLVFAVCVGTVVALAALTALLARAEAIRRVVLPEGTEDVRSQVWMPIARMAWQYFPVGSGGGSFEAVFKTNEPDALLRSTYLNHAHNDWLEVYLTFGATGVALLLLAAAMWLYATWRVWRTPASAGHEIGYARLGSVLLLLMGLASVVDYPVRVPSIACLLVIASVWLRAGTGGGVKHVATPKSGGISDASDLGAQAAV